MSEYSNRKAFAVREKVSYPENEEECEGDIEDTKEEDNFGNDEEFEQEALKQDRDITIPNYVSINAIVSQASIAASLKIGLPNKSSSLLHSQS
ncbi:hypothetical protein HAX54_042528 [Datura stramonium]|uniref:Uncharacterized protein n=1 Tax=Datura stramonium TaxID=4076 RepID=A0ABS8W1D6_DATST|nr:hypothetical protein [Datura stramonium]